MIRVEAEGLCAKATLSAGDALLAVDGMLIPPNAHAAAMARIEQARGEVRLVTRSKYSAA